MAKAKKQDKELKPERFKLELEFYTRGPVKKIPSVNYSYNTEADEPGIPDTILDSKEFTDLYDVADRVAALLKDAGLI